ncbi:MAG: TCR/Tet family MFS transporter [Boseongicola sp. SB0673_bin_14]|nr:TCR/Tet family MFS transporter [Boseongicola sp. SB0673_bin_14]
MTDRFQGGRLPLFFVLATVAIDAIGIGIIIPVMPDLILEVGGGTLGSAAVWGGVLASVFAVMQLLFGPTIGNLSDRYGRRPVLLISLFFMGIDYIVMGVAHTIWLLFVGRVIGGLTASTQPTVAAYIADISEPDEKAQNFGLIGAAFGIGFVLGPLFGAAFAEFGTRAPFYAAAAFSLGNMVFGWIVLPETVTDEIRRPFDWKRANPLGGLINVGRLPGLKLLLAIMFFFQVAFTVYPAIWAYYTLERFGWEPWMIGVTLAAYGVATAVVQGWLIRVVLTYMSERQAVLFGFGFEMIGFFGYGIITETWQVFVLIPLGSLGAVALPALQGIMSRTALDNQQWELQGVLTSVVSLAMIISPLIMTLIFREFVKPGSLFYLPGAPFLLAFLLTLLCFGLMCLTPKRVS